MSTFRCLVPSWFEDIEAATEEEAKQKMAELIKSEINENYVIAWENPK